MLNILCPPETFRKRQPPTRLRVCFQTFVSCRPCNYFGDCGAYFFDKHDLSLYVYLDFRALCLRGIRHFLCLRETGPEVINLGPFLEVGAWD